MVLVSVWVLVWMWVVMMGWWSGVGLLVRGMGGVLLWLLFLWRAGMVVVVGYVLGLEGLWGGGLRWGVGAEVEEEV